MSQGLSNEEVVRRYGAASAAAELAELARLRHPDWSVDWPQSGERVASSESFAAILDRYPGGRPRTQIEQIVGSEDRWVVTAGNTILRVVGSGDSWWTSYRITDPDGTEYHCIDLMQIRDGMVFHETVYWAPAFEAPAWRAPFVERVEPANP